MTPEQVRGDRRARSCSRTPTTWRCGRAKRSSRSSAGCTRFMRWDGPILTDSGGFQVFSLPEARRSATEGVRFSNEVDGERDGARRPSARSRSRTRSAPTSSWRSTSARRYPADARARAARRRRTLRLARALHAGARAARRPGALRHRAGQRRIPTLRRGVRRGARRDGLPGLRDRRRVGRRGPRAARAASTASPRRCCPRTSPAT